MASDKTFLEYVLEQLSELDDVTFRSMMGEYILYYRGRIFGGIYDNRFLVKPTPSASSLMPDAVQEIPYDGAKAMLSVDNTDDREFLKRLIEGMYPELPEPASKRRKSGK